MVFSFTDQPNFMAAHVDLVLHFFESLLNKNTTCEVGPVGIIKSLKMATLNSSRERFYRLIKAPPDFSNGLKIGSSHVLLCFCEITNENINHMIIL